MDLPELRLLRQQAERWIEGDPDPRTQGELRALLAKPDAELAKTDLADRFAQSLEFGTAGLRGVLGAGSNRMNRAVVARATWGLAQHLLATVPRAAERGVVVGCDARHLSTELSEDTAAILAAAGIKVVLFRHPVPTPQVGYAVKKLGAAAGVVVTASHNPPEYNGYKVYWQNAAQIIPPIDAGIAAQIARAPAGKDVERPSLQSVMARRLVTEASPDLERGYLDAVLGLQVHPGQGDRALGIVYTPMHGVGDDLLRRAMAAAGFPNVTSVPEQQKPDGAFPTVAFPNPEEKGAMDLSLALARKTGAALACSTRRSRRRPARGRRPGLRRRERRLPAAHGQPGGGAARPLPAHRAGRGRQQARRPRVARVIAPPGADRRLARRPVRGDAHGLQVDRQPRARART